MNAAKIPWPLFIRRVAIGSKKNGEEFHGFHQNHPPIIGSNRLQTHQKTSSRRMVCPSKKSHPHVQTKNLTPHPLIANKKWKSNMTFQEMVPK